MTDSGPTVRRISIGAFAIWLVLIAIEYGHVPGLQAAWGFSLLRHQPSWLGWLLAGMALVVTTEEMRRGLIGLARGTARVFGRLPEPGRDLLLFAIAVSLLWIFRERHLFGLSKALLLLLAADEPAQQVPIGAALLLRATLRSATWLGLPPAATAEMTSCLFGASSIVLLTRAARAIGAGPQRVLIPLLVFSGGLLRAGVGRIDLQPVVVTAACAWLLLAVRKIRTGGRLRAGAIVVGIAACLQPLCFFLLPGLVLVAALSKPAGSARSRTRRVASALGWAVVPLLAYGVGIEVAYSSSDVGIADTLATMIGANGWLGGSGQNSRIGTHYALFSGSHLAYLVNAGFVLAAAALPLLLGCAIGSPRRLYGEPVAAFLAVSCASLLIGACMTRPGFGALEWDKFAVTGLFLTFFAGYLLSEIRADLVRGQLAAALIGLQFFFVGLPLVCLVFQSTGSVGPSSHAAFSNWTPGADAPPAAPTAPLP